MGENNEWMIMFEELKKYEKIYVTGAQRSGTRIAAKMIAQDTGYRFIDETEWGLVTIDKLKDIHTYDSKFVVQCPGAFYCIEQFSDKDTLIVYMDRDVEEIEDSKTRIMNRGLHNTKGKYQTVNKDAVIPAAIRLSMWVQKRPSLTAYIELPYNSLQGHPLWIPKEKRKGFSWHQTYEGQWKNTVEKQAVREI
jgi:hypothetical protein